MTLNYDKKSILNPASKLGTYQKLSRYYEQPDFDYVHILRTMDIICDGIPLSMCITSGSDNEQTTAIPLEKQLIKKLSSDLQQIVFNDNGYHLLSFDKEMSVQDMKNFDRFTPENKQHNNLFRLEEPIATIALMSSSWFAYSKMLFLMLAY